MQVFKLVFDRLNALNKTCNSQQSIELVTEPDVAANSGQPLDPVNSG